MAEAEHALSPFEGKPVVAVGIEMPNAAGGLQSAMKFDPMEVHQGDEGYIVLHYVAQKVRFEPIDKDQPSGPQRRVHVLNVDKAAPIAAEYVEEKLQEYQAHVERLKKEAEGQDALPGIEEPRDKFQRLSTVTLKELCKANTLSSAGSKQDLIQRLIDNDIDPPADEPNE